MRGRARQRLNLTTGFVLFLAFTGLYIFLSPGLASQPWDSLAYGYSAEINDISAIWGNHPLGHLIFSMVFRLAKEFGYQGRALTVFQTVNAVLGGFIIAAFFAVLVSIIKVKAQLALGFSLVLGASYSFWFFAGTGDIYHFTILFSLLAWAMLVYEVIIGSHRLPLASGFLTGLSILFHQLSAILIPIGMALILFPPHLGNQPKRKRIEQTASFIVSTLAVAVTGYLLLGYIATSSLSISGILGWMQGYFGDPTYGRYLNSEVFWAAWMAISQTVIFSPMYKIEFASLGLLVFFLLIVVFGFIAREVLDERKRAILNTSALQCLITWPLILWWEPQNPKFWLLTLVPFVMLLALSFEALSIRLKDLLPAYEKDVERAVNALPLLLGGLILITNIQHIDGDQEALAFQEALSIWTENSSQEDVIITAGDIIPQLRYWGMRPNTIYLYRSLQAGQTSLDGFSDLRAQIDQAICSHHTALITPAASEYITEDQLSIVGVSREELRSFLDENANRGEIVFWYRDLFDGKLLPVYALRQSTTCSTDLNRKNTQILH